MYCIKILQIYKVKQYEANFRYKYYFVLNPSSFISFAAFPWSIAFQKVRDG